MIGPDANITHPGNAMDTLIRRSIETIVRSGLDWRQTWEDLDHGLIKCWEVGRERARQQPELAERCRAGELPVLGWKGGVSRALKKQEKFGSLKYLAQWQGLRGEDLDIDTTGERILTCTRTAMVVTFTPDQRKYFNQLADSDPQPDALPLLQAQRQLDEAVDTI